MDAIISAARKAYATKEYEEAVELFGDACAAYAELKGEESPDLLYDYGKSLFQVAVKNSTLLNSEAVEQSKLPAEEEQSEHSDFSFAPEAEDEDEDGDEEADKDEDADAVNKEQDADASEERAETAEGEEKEAEQEEEEDDFEAAWRILDLCRVLFLKQLPEGGREIETKLADTYALLGEIAIEDDNYPQAAEDFESALKLKEKLFESDAKELSEANYMLGLAYEFKAETAEDSKKALSHLETALEIAKKAKTDPKTVQELEQKVKDLGHEIKSNSDSKEAVTDAANGIIGREAIAGVLNQMLSGANDISSLARKKKAPKRPATDADAETDTKKAKK